MSITDEKRFFRELQQLGPDQVRNNLGNRNYGPPYDRLARKWLQDYERVGTLEGREATLRVARRRLVVALGALILGILTFALSIFVCQKSKEEKKNVPVEPGDNH
jgi:hypothetical protein